VPAQEINGRPNYNMVRSKVAGSNIVFWGIAGFAVGLFDRFPIGVAGAQFRICRDEFGRLRPLHTSAVIFAFAAMF